ncbi:MAG: ABC transporter [Deltaproteobacteria bacterium]|nr:ABC transporter [Deltaproteobacteria bacterium]
MSNLLSIQNVMHQYGKTTVFSHLNLSMEHGEWVGLLGGSGCGKTTLLRCIAGLITPSEGSIHLEDKDITHSPPNERGVGLVFQDYALFPTCTVQENINFGRVSNAPTCAELLSLISLQGMEHRLPSQLSGGQQQRVALARALAAQPKLLLLDEPFANIDAYKKSSLIQELKHLLKGVAVLFVTHDRSDAMAIADRLAVFDMGGIAQFDTPFNVYTKPSTVGVAEKTGFSTIIPCCGTGKIRETALGKFHVHSSESSGQNLLIRPEDLSCTMDGPYLIEEAYYLGGRYQYLIRQGKYTINIFGEFPLKRGTHVSLKQKNPLWIIPQSSHEEIQ